jgi:hypothetical protein
MINLRVQIATSEWRALQQRAAARRSSAAQYAGMILSYPIQGPIQGSLVQRPARSMDDPDEEIYVQLAVPERTRNRLSDRSHRHQTSVAAYAGLLLSSFLKRYPTDPRDLRMMEFLTMQLYGDGTLSESDLVHALGRVDANSGVRLPPGYLAKWLHSRLQPLVRRVARQGAEVDLTIDLVEELIGRPGRPG